MIFPSAFLKYQSLYHQKYQTGSNPRRGHSNMYKYPQPGSEFFKPSPLDCHSNRPLTHVMCIQLTILTCNVSLTLIPSEFTAWSRSWPQSQVFVQSNHPLQSSRKAITKVSKYQCGNGQHVTEHMKKKAVGNLKNLFHRHT